MANSARLGLTASLCQDLLPERCFLQDLLMSGNFANCVSEITYIDIGSSFAGMITFTIEMHWPILRASARADTVCLLITR